MAFIQWFKTITKLVFSHRFREDTLTLISLGLEATKLGGLTTLLEFFAYEAIGRINIFDKLSLSNKISLDKKVQNFEEVGELKFDKLSAWNDETKEFEELNK